MTQDKITADTVTAKQIREERRLQREDGNRINVQICNTALGQLRGVRGQVATFALEEIAQAKALIASAINSRRETESSRVNQFCGYADCPGGAHHAHDPNDWTKDLSPEAERSK